MAAPKGNNYGSLAAYCKTKEHRIEAFKAYCKHVEEGNLKESFTWDSDDGKGMATYDTIKYMKEKFAHELPLFLLQRADAKNLHKWQSLAYELASGAKKGEGFVWINNMHNRFKHLGWNISQPKEDTSQVAEQQAKQDKVANLADEINGKGHT